MSNEISNSDDVIDSRDVIARIEELQSEREDAFEAAHSTWDNDESVRDGMTRDEFADEHWKIAHPAEAEELTALEALADEASGYAADWQHGEALIRDSYFKEYAQQLAEDIGAINANATWPNNCIDWEQAARELQVDYTQVDFDGVAYWIR